MRPCLATILGLALLGCSSAPPPTPPLAPDAAVAPPKPSPPRFIDDDFAGSLARAKAEGKALFVDAWAPWCHSCLSMKQVVLGEPALGALSDRVVFAAIDVDRPEAAAFLEKYPAKTLPAFLVIDPASGSVLGRWEGSASLREARAFIEESLARGRGGADDPASRAFAEARALHAAGELAGAAGAYERAITAAPASWPSRSAALVGWIGALSGARSWSACARVGAAHALEVRGSAAPADFAATLLSCVEHLPADALAVSARRAAITSLRAHTASPPADASDDDRQDALGLLAEALESVGDAPGARRAQEDRLILLERAVKAARSAESAHTHDYGRALTYVALGRGDEAVRMLEQRERELPGAYEPPARLAGVLFKMGKLVEARAAVKRAIVRSYGPRRLRYLELEARILGELGDRAARIEALREEVKGWESLPPGQASPERTADARRRLSEATAH